MKKLFSLLIITTFVLSVNAQKTYVLAGVNLANITRTSDGQTEDNNVLTTFNVGFMDRFGLSPIIDLETGLLFTGKGSKAETSYNNGNVYIKTAFNPYYIELPLNLLLKFPIGAGSNFFVNAGPYLAMGVAGKSKSETRIFSVVSNSEENIKFNDDDPSTDEQEDARYDKLKRFDYGINVGGGIAFKHFILKANYGLGFAKINSTQRDDNENDKNKFRTVSFSVGIPF